jgi:hypothetical protein
VIWKRYAPPDPWPARPSPASFVPALVCLFQRWPERSAWLSARFRDGNGKSERRAAPQRSGTASFSPGWPGVHTMFDPDRFYRPPEIIVKSHVPREVVYAALHSGELKSLRRGPRFLIPGSCVIEWLREVAG